MTDGRGVIRVGHEAFAAGLFWQPAPTAASAAREARIVSSRAELGADLFCVRRRGVPQFGLAQRSQGHRPGLRALAAAVADCRAEGSWVGVFPVPERWLYLAVRKGAIMPDGDLLFEREEDARQHLAQDLVPGEWEAVFAPAAWAVPDSRPLALSETVSPMVDARLRPVSRRWGRPLLWAAVVLAGGAGLWLTMGTGPAERKDPVPVTPAPPPPPPWQSQPAAAAVIAACRGAIEAAPVVPGFEMESASCGAAGASATYRRTGGTLAWAPAAAAVAAPDRVVLPLALSAPLGRRAGLDAVGSADTLRRRIWGAAQTYRLDTELSEGPPPVHPSGDAAPVPAFRVFAVSLGGRLPPDVLSVILAGIPAFVVDEVAWQPPAWRVKGKAYVR
jgi:hypothetical protein